VRNWHKIYEAHVSCTVSAWGTTAHLMVTRRDGRDGIPWDMLQQIKDEMLGPEVLCVEIYPPAAEVVNEVNMRHLWEVPEGVLLVGLKH
jgi:hypothetical protein